MSDTVQKKIITLTCFILLSVSGLSAGNFREGIPVDPSQLLGQTISGFLELLGPPASIFPLRGEEAWQDDVVCYYTGGVSLYLYQDRVWQIRFDRNSQGSWAGFGIGASPAEVAEGVGWKPLGRGEDWEIYFLSELPFPLRLRVFYSEGRADDFYLYRGDF